MINYHQVLRRDRHRFFGSRSPPSAMLPTAGGMINLMTIYHHRSSPDDQLLMITIIT
jgi:hypothetical protein